MWFRNNKRIVKTNYQLIDQIYRCTSDLFNIEQMFKFSHEENEIYLFVPLICNIDIYISIHFFILNKTINHLYGTFRVRYLPKRMRTSLCFKNFMKSLFAKA